MAEYTRQIMKVVVAKICQTIGWHSINSTPLDIMVDILRRYFIELTRLTHAYSTQFGHVQPNLDELGLAFRDMHINITDLEEYIQYVDSSPSLEIPVYPVPKESHLNFLKPGSNEVVTRPVHIHEHLPPMLPEREEAELSNITIKKEEAPTSPNIDYGSAVFKRPADIIIDTPCKRPRLLIEEEGRPTREISSVMMTTSGFLSPAREGKLPEARTPANTLDQMAISSLQSLSHAVTNSGARFDRKTVKVIKDIKKMDRKKDRTSKELFKVNLDDPVIKKIPIKEPKSKMLNKINAVSNILPPIEIIEKPSINVGKNGGTPKPLPAPKPKVLKAHKNEKQLLPPPQLVEKIIPILEEKVIEGKLSSEPDKVKLNIFKKISKVKEDKVDKIEKIKIKEEPRITEILTQSRESSPDLIIDESDIKNWDHTKNLSFPGLEIIPIKPEVKPVKVPIVVDLASKMYDIVKSSPHSEKDFMYDEYISPPGTPLTPKTPEMPSQSPPAKVEKRKKKDKNKIKKSQGLKPTGTNRTKPDFVELELDRPKTPDDPINLVKNEQINTAATPPMFPFFPSFSGGPGLIPPPMNNPLFPRLPANIVKHGFGQPAHIPAMATLPFVSIKPVEETPEPPPPVVPEPVPKPEKENFETIAVKEKHKKDKKDKVKKKSKKDKIKNKSEKRKIKEEKREKDKIKKVKKEKKKEKERVEHEGSLPKLTLKISSPRPPTPDAQIARKIMIKPIVKKEESMPTSTSSTSESLENRQPSPELARISALITRPPKLKASKESHVNKEETGASQVVPNQSPKPNGSSAGRSRLCNLNKASVTTPVLQNDDKPVGAKLQKSNTPNQPSSSQDAEENKVWICPACGNQDDGSPMIGCDDCDAWYHWVCVGIQVPPDDSEDWYCRICIVKKQEMLQVDKKKKRKKKEKKNAD